MIAKVQYFPTYDSRNNVNDPLASNVILNSVYIERNGSKIIFNQCDSEIYPSIDVSEIIQYNNYVIYVAELSTYEDIDLVDVDFSGSNAVKTSDVVSSDKKVITLKSEDESKIIDIYIVRKDLGVDTGGPLLYNIESNTEVNTSNELNIDCGIYVPTVISNTTDSLTVGAIDLPESYITYEYNGSVNTDEEALSININGGTVTYISIDGDDPDDETLLDGVTDALTLVNSAVFTITEESLLDANFVYLKLERNSETVYYKLIKNYNYSEQTKPYIETLKTKLSDKYIYLFFGYIAIPIENITFSDISRLSMYTTHSDVIEDLITNDIEYFDISIYYNDLIDSVLTEQLNTFSLETSYNTLYIDTEYGFIESDVANFGKVIAKLMYDKISTELDDNSDYIHPAIVEYLSYIAELKTAPNYWTNTSLISVSEDLYTAYKTEASSANFMINNFTVRHFDWIEKRLRYALNLIKNNEIVYYATNEQISRMISAMQNLKQIANFEQLTTNSLTETYINTFVSELYKLKVQENLIQRISF